MRRRGAARRCCVFDEVEDDLHCGIGSLGAPGTSLGQLSADLPDGSTQLVTASVEMIDAPLTASAELGDSQPGSLAQSVEALDLSGSLANLFCCYFGSVPPASTAPLVTSVGSLAAAVAGAPMIQESVADLGVAPPLLPALPPLSRIPAR